MNNKYTDCVEQVSRILFEAISKREENLGQKISQIDTDLLSLLRTIGLRVMSMLLAMVVNQVTAKGIRPVAEKLGITPGSLSLGVTRALVDFGSEESFA